MRVRLLIAVVLLSGLACPALSDGPQAKQGSEAVDRAAVAALIQEGNALHDRGDFDAAIQKYREALALAPDDGGAMYEIAFSLFAKKDLKAAAEVANAALRGANVPRGLFVLLGNIYDDMGESALAMRAYRSGIASDPGLFLSYFNLGIAYERLNAYTQARACLENSVALAPLHPGSHFALGRVYRAMRYRVPAIMAVTRGLSLEPRSDRAKAFHSILDEIFHAGLETDEKGNSKITIDPDAPKDEGDFSDEIVIPMFTLSETVIPKAGEKLEGPPGAHRLIMLLKSVGERDAKTLGKGFAAEFYGPFYQELVRENLTKGFVAIALAGVDAPGFAEWRSQNGADMKKVAAMLTRYQWKAPKLPPLPPEPEKASQSPTPTAH